MHSLGFPYMIMIFRRPVWFVLMILGRHWGGEVFSFKTPQTCLPPFNLGQLLDKKLFAGPPIPCLGSSVLQLSLVRSCKWNFWKGRSSLRAQCCMNLLFLFHESHWRNLQVSGACRYLCCISWFVAQLRPFLYGVLEYFLYCLNHYFAQQY